MLAVFGYKFVYLQTEYIEHRKTEGSTIQNCTVYNTGRRKAETTLGLLTRSKRKTDFSFSLLAASNDHHCYRMMALNMSVSTLASQMD